MVLRDIYRSLESGGRVIEGLLRDVTPDQAAWRPAEGKWSLLEVINHLYDEEREDFRAELKIIWERPGEPWVQIDPMAWVNARGYAQRNFQESLEKFVTERRASLDWLNTLDNPDWEREHGGPKPFEMPMRAGDVMSAWLAHDQVHIRQISWLKSAWLYSAQNPWNPEYAGDFPLDTLRKQKA